MIVNPGIVTQAKRNGSNSGQYVPRGGQSINAERVVDLLAEQSAPRAQPGARALLQAMSAQPWVVMASQHVGGMGGDQTAHITVRVDRMYHLRLDRGGVVFDITHQAGGDTQRLAGNLPWEPPGA